MSESGPKGSPLERQGQRRLGRGGKVAAVAVAAALTVTGAAFKLTGGSGENVGKEVVTEQEYSPLIRQGVREIVKSSHIESTTPQTQPNGQQDFTHRTDKHGLAIGASRHTSRSEIEAVGITLYDFDGKGTRLDIMWTDRGEGPGAAPETFRAASVDKNNHSHKIAELGYGPVTLAEVEGAQNAIAIVQGVINQENQG